MVLLDLQMLALHTKHISLNLNKLGFSKIDFVNTTSNATDNLALLVQEVCSVIEDCTWVLVHFKRILHSWYTSLIKVSAQCLEIARLSQLKVLYEDHPSTIALLEPFSSMSRDLHRACGFHHASRKFLQINQIINP